MEPDLISGEWRDFSVRVVETEDFDGVVEHLKDHFIVDEPIQRYVGMTEDRKKDLEERVRGLLNLEDTICFMALDKISGKIASVLIILHMSKDKTMPELQSNSPLTKIVRDFIINLEFKKVDIFEKFGVDHFAEIFVISTASEFRGKGLATEMYRRAIALLGAMSYPVVTSSFSNPLSRKIGKKLGFEEITRSYFSEMKNPLVEANLALPHVTSGGDETELYACVTALVLK